MADDTARPADEPKAIDVSEPYELSYWSVRFGVTRERLEEIVKKVGPRSIDVARALGKD